MSQKIDKDSLLQRINEVNIKSKAEKLFLEQVIESLENDSLSWDAGYEKVSLPMNGSSNKYYKGINSANLQLRMMREGWKCNEFFTFNQAKDNGYKVKKGSKGSLIEFFQYYDKKEKKELDITDWFKLSEEEKSERRKDIKVIHNTYYVFNGEQLDNYSFKERSYLFNQNERAEHYLDNLITNMHIKVQYTNQTECFYSPSHDLINLPKKEYWYNSDSFYHVAFHELSHATKHPNRLNRKSKEGSYTFGSKEYAYEELVAETSATFQSIGLDLNIQNNATAYIQNWAAGIHHDPKLFIESIKEALLVRDYMFEQGEIDSLMERVDEKEVIVERDDMTYKKALLDERINVHTDAQKKKTISILLETTGPIVGVDDIVHLSIVDENDEEIFESKFKPRKKSRASKREYNPIENFFQSDPIESYEESSAFEEYKQKIQEIINKADLIVGWNNSRTQRFLEEQGIDFGRTRQFDMMREHAKTHGEWNPRNNKYGWRNFGETMLTFNPAYHFEQNKHISKANHKLMKSYLQQVGETNALNKIKKSLETIERLKKYAKIQNGRLNKVELLKEPGYYASLNVERKSLLKVRFNEDGTKETETVAFGSLIELSKHIEDICNLDNLKDKNLEDLVDVKNNPLSNLQSTKEKTLKEDLDKLKQIVPIVAYAESELGMKVLPVGHRYSTLAEHDSVRIYDDNSFHRFSKSNSGGSIIDFIMEFDNRCQGLGQKEKLSTAIKLLSEFYTNNKEAIEVSGQYVVSTNDAKKIPKTFEAPLKAEDNKEIIDYLERKRKIDRKVVDEWIEAKRIYQSDRQHNNSRIPQLVYAGEVKPGSGVIKYAAIRGLGNSHFKQDVSGSFKQIGVYHSKNSNTLVITESVIDAMSYQTLHPSEQYNYLSVNGVQSSERCIDFHLQQRITENPKETRIIIALDNDEAGIDASERLKKHIEDNYEGIDIVIDTPSIGKDFNEELVKGKEIKEVLAEQNSSINKQKENTQHNTKNQGVER